MIGTCSRIVELQIARHESIEGRVFFQKTLFTERTRTAATRTTSREKDTRLLIRFGRFWDFATSFQSCYSLISGMFLLGSVTQKNDPVVAVC